MSDGERRSAALAAKRHLLRLGAFRRAHRLAIYLSVDGEIDLGPIIIAALARKKSLYAPVLERGSMQFARIREDAELRDNQFGIPEPRNGTHLDPRCLDVVLTPLVAFDDAGTRLGMGGGHYDRCFRFLGPRSRWLSPKLIGMGYEFQRLQRIEQHSWDVPLWAAVTEKGIYRFERLRG